MSEIEQQRNQGVTDRKAGQGERLAAYLAKLDDLKSRGSLREVVEREMLLEFLKLNQLFIDEYPLLESQQQTIASIIFQPTMTPHPGYDFIHKKTDQFFANLNRYRHAEKNQDESAMAELVTQIYNQEMVLIKCVQGMVYSLYMVLDNFFEVTANYFGLAGVAVYEDFTKNYEARDKFWKAYFGEFFARSIPLAYEHLAESKEIKISKTSSYIILSIAFDKILQSLRSQEAPPELSRIQAKFRQVGAGKEGLAYYRRILEILLKADDSAVTSGLGKSMLSYLGKAICMDDGIKHYCDELDQQAAGAPDAATAEAFFREQVFALALGAGMAIQTMQDDFISALEWMTSKETEVIRERFLDLDMASAYRLFFDLMESYFVFFLQSKGQSEGAKIQYRLTSARRAPVATIKQLIGQGLDSQVISRIWEKDESRPDMMLFIPATLKALRGLTESLNLNPVMSDALARLWEYGPVKAEAHVIVDLAAVAKTTTNLNKKLADILQSYGVLRAG